MRENKSPEFSLSKSRYCLGVQCPKILWLSQFHPEAFDDSGVNQAVLETGSAVGDLAMGLLGDFTEVPYGTRLEMTEQTERLMEKQTPVIAEASFSVDGLFCSVDLLKRIDEHTVELYEVKSSTAVHEIYLQDVAFQTYVLTKLGYTVRKCCLVYINSQYERIGDLNLQELFRMEPITEPVRLLLPEVAERVENLKAYMKQEAEPQQEIGEQCNAPYACGFFGYCTRALPKPNIFDVSGARFSTKIKCYRNSLISFEELYRSKVLSAGQNLQVEQEYLQSPPHIDRKKIEQFLKTVTYPLYFLDFESFQPAVPLYDRSHPYEQIVFQYSLHKIETEGGELRHREFLADPHRDPRREVAEHLCKDIPLGVCTTAYNMSFEKSRIRGLAELYPDLSAHLMDIHDHIVDLMVPFQKKWYYNRAMQGSYSIKYVLPALFPDDPSLDYHRLEGVHNGSEASNAFAKMAEMNGEELQTARTCLLRYCGLDTFAMVKVYQKLKEAVGEQMEIKQNP